MILEIVVKNSWSPLFQDDWCEVSEDTLEMDDLNRHECMAKMSSLLKHLVDKRISPNQPKVCLIWAWIYRGTQYFFWRYKQLFTYNLLSVTVSLLRRYLLFGLKLQMYWFYHTHSHIGSYNLCAVGIRRFRPLSSSPLRVRPYLIPCSPPHFSSSTPPSRVRPQIESCLN